MDTFLQQLINGLVLGSIYALVALGYTMVYGIMELINFAHGEVTMSGAMVSVMTIGLLVASGIALPGAVILLIALLVAMVVCALLGFTIERVAYRPLRKAPRLAPLITAIGVSIVLQNVAMMIWGKQYISFPAILEITRYDIGGASITNLQITIILLSLTAMALLLTLINNTRLGRAMRATAQAPAVASLMGVNVNSIISITFILGSLLAALAGLMVSAYYGLAHYNMGFLLGLKAFTAAVLGGIGNIPGAVLGGLLLGIIESLGASYIGPLTGGVLGSHYQDAVAFFVLILVLTLRPSGLLGERIAERP
ncbi:MAG: branched-chain amino acid transport system permease protein [Halothiobacillaceae bacterium]|nr:MAG: branched-chain amino acid transport system permease protein [Halothiobacillaceae bacterium]